MFGAGALLLLAVTLCACGPSAETAGYDRIGTVGTDVLFARVEHESDGDYVAVLLRDQDGRELCNARSPLMTIRQVPAVCDGTTPDAFVYVSQEAKHGPTPSLCRADGEPAAVHRLKTDAAWAADFVVEVERPGGEESSFIGFCAPGAALD